MGKLGDLGVCAKRFCFKNLQLYLPLNVYAVPFDERIAFHAARSLKQEP
jgi:hypothetical protein